MSKLVKLVCLCGVLSCVIGCVERKSTVNEKTVKENTHESRNDSIIEEAVPSEDNKQVTDATSQSTYEKDERNEKEDARGEGNANRVSRDLNDIRFSNFSEKDFLDNDYIKELRTYINAINAGTIKDENIESFKHMLKGKFVIGNVSPHMLGGLYLKIIFLEHPANVFSSWVYSSVDEDKEIVIGYEVKSLTLDDGKTSFTKEDILRLIKEHPEYKCW